MAEQISPMSQGPPPEGGLPGPEAAEGQAAWSSSDHGPTARSGLWFGWGVTFNVMVVPCAPNDSLSGVFRGQGETTLKVVYSWVLTHLRKANAPYVD